MYITRIEHRRGKHYRIYAEDSFLFALYGRELKQYHIAENEELEDGMVQFLQKEVVLKRAKERALYLLERRPYTVSGMQNKLRENDYPDPVIDEVINFLKKYRYLDDQEYIRMYVEAYSYKKSKRQLMYDLAGRGVDRDMVNDYFATFDFSEEESLQRQFRRYVKGRDLEDRTVRQKVFRYFYGKGFAASMIEETMESYRTIDAV